MLFYIFHHFVALGPTPSHQTWLIENLSSSMTLYQLYFNSFILCVFSSNIVNRKNVRCCFVWHYIYLCTRNTSNRYQVLNFILFFIFLLFFANLLTVFNHTPILFPLITRSCHITFHIRKFCNYRNLKFFMNILRHSHFHFGLLFSCVIILYQFLLKIILFIYIYFEM